MSQNKNSAQNSQGLTSGQAIQQMQQAQGGYSQQQQLGQQQPLLSQHQLASSVINVPLGYAGIYNGNFHGLLTTQFSNADIDALFADPYFLKKMKQLVFRDQLEKVLADDK